MNARRFLPGRYAAPANLLLSSRRFTCDHLLIAADAYAELAVQCVAYGHLHAARDACQLADLLRAAAPGRVPRRDRVFPNPSSL